jgi:DNA-binding transcriptional ArsR family regulator
MLVALLAGPALTATELAQEAGLTLSTVSGHLARLERAGLVAIERQGRHRYFRLADPDVATALESLMPVATRAGHLRVRTGPRDPELRRARSCYDHLAGDLAVTMFDRFVERKFLTRRNDELCLTGAGRRFFARSGIDVAALETAGARVCRAVPRLERAPHPSQRHLGRCPVPAHAGSRLGGEGTQEPRGSLFACGRAEGPGMVFPLKRRPDCLPRIRYLSDISAF